MGTKWLDSSAQQCTRTSVVGVQKVPSQHDALEHPPYYPDLSPPDFFLFARLKCVQKAQRFESVEEVIAKMMKAVTEVSKNCFQQYFQKPYERREMCFTVQRNNSEGNV
jgi:hypothetical protein